MQSMVALSQIMDILWIGQTREFFLNTALTVRAHEANSHSKKGWEKFTDRIIEVLMKEKSLLYLYFGEIMLKRKLN